MRHATAHQHENAPCAVVPGILAHRISDRSCQRDVNSAIWTPTAQYSVLSVFQVVTSQFYVSRNVNHTTTKLPSMDNNTAVQTRGGPNKTPLPFHTAQRYVMIACMWLLTKLKHAWKVECCIQPWQPLNGLKVVLQPGTRQFTPAACTNV